MVGIVRATYLDTEIKLRKLLKLIGYTPKKDRILLKPNAASAYGHYLLGDYTAPQILEAFARIYSDLEIVIAEGSAVGMAFPDAARMLGYDRVARRCRNVSLVDLDTEPREAFDWKYGTLRIPKIALESEYVNCPKMKTHHLCGVTLGMKNQKGLLDDATKKKFHQIDIHDAIRELARIVPPDLTIVDGIVALEGNGPNSIIAQPKLMNLLVAGADMIEVDNACLEIMQIPRGMAEHIPAAEVKTAGERIGRVARRFKPPEKEGPFLKVAGVRFSCGCSGCMESISGGLRGMIAPEELPALPPRIVSLIRYGLLERMYIFMGSENEMPDAPGRMICVGNCTRKFAEQHNLPFFPGCPPDPESLRKILD